MMTWLLIACSLWVPAIRCCEQRASVESKQPKSPNQVSEFSVLGEEKLAEAVPQEIVNIAISTKGHFFASLTNSGNLYLWKLGSKKALWTYSGVNWLHRALAFQKGEFSLYFCSSKEGICKLCFSQKPYTISKICKPSNDQCSAIAVSPSHRTIAFGGSDVSFCDYVTGKVISTVPFPHLASSGSVETLQYSPDGKWLACIMRNGKRYIINTKDCKIRQFDLKNPNFLHHDCIFFSTDQILTIRYPLDGFDTRCFLFDLCKKENLIEYDLKKLGFDYHVCGMTYDGHYLVCKGFQSFFLTEVWTGQLVLRINHSCKSLPIWRISDDSRILVVVTSSNVIKVYDLSLGHVFPDRKSSDQQHLIDNCLVKLRSENAQEAYEASWNLIALGSPVVTKLSNEFAPMPKATAKRISYLLGELGRDEYTKRELAFQELRGYRYAAQDQLILLQSKTQDAEVRHRVSVLLSKLDVTTHQLYLLRCVRILEQIGTPEAITLLTRLSKRTSAVFQAKSASSALERHQRSAQRKYSVTD